MATSTSAFPANGSGHRNGADPAQTEPAGAAGVVWLVGAGPGDPGLITVHGLRCIGRADVIVYDRLANPSLLDGARPDCEIVYAGKRVGRHAMDQDEINALLSAKALDGKRVCRLKGGDPFVFGRGGEEALYLRRHGVPFEVVPGVSSAVAAPAYAGIPVTHRGLASSLRIITGHEDPAKPDSDLDWHEIGGSGGTLVFLMGLRNLAMITERLIANGRGADTPAAVIASGTLPTQRTVLATLADITGRVQEADIAPPAVLVVGEVAGLRPALEWFERKPLFGRSVVVTRARAQASELAGSLETLGAEVIQIPMIRIESLADSAAMRAAARDAGTVQWVVFTSVNGVSAFLDALAIEGLDSRALAGTRIAAVGSATVDRLHRSGLRADLVPARFMASGLLDAFDTAGPLRGQTVLLPCSAIAWPDLADGLRERGAEVVEVAAYRTIRGDALPDWLLDRIERDAIDLVTFTSSSTVRHFVDALPVDRRQDLLGRVRAASIGPATSASLHESGVIEAVSAAESTIAGLTAAILEYLAD